MQKVGRLGSIVEPIITPKAKRLVVEVPIYFPQYIPGRKNSSFDVMAIFFDEVAERLNDMAQKDMNKDGELTQGKGMLVEVLGRLFTDKWEDKDTKRIIKITKMYVYDVSYPSIFSSPKNNNQNANTNQNQQSNPSQQVANHPPQNQVHHPSENQQTVPHQEQNHTQNQTQYSQKNKQQNQQTNPYSNHHQSNQTQKNRYISTNQTEDPLTTYNDVINR